MEAGEKTGLQYLIQMDPFFREMREFFMSCENPPPLVHESMRLLDALLAIGSDDQKVLLRWFLAYFISEEEAAKMTSAEVVACLAKMGFYKEHVEGKGTWELLKESVNHLIAPKHSKDAIPPDEQLEPLIIEAPSLNLIPNDVQMYMKSTPIPVGELDMLKEKKKNLKENNVDEITADELQKMLGYLREKKDLCKDLPMPPESDLTWKNYFRDVHSSGMDIKPFLHHHYELHQLVVAALKLI